MRRYLEDVMVLEDWFEVFVAQNVALEGLLYPLVFERLNARLNALHGPVVSLLTRFASEWYTESAKWVSAVIKLAAADSPANQTLLSTWTAHWRERAMLALAPLAQRLALCSEVSACLPTPSSPSRRTKTRAASWRLSSRTTPVPSWWISPPW
jgi:phenol hydroxylase P1 protein